MTTVCDDCDCNCCHCCECDCQCDCCVNCDGDICCEILFYFGECGVCCVLWNVLSIPVRLVLTFLLIGMVFGMMMGFMMMMTVMWIVICVLASLFVVPCELICSAPFPVNVLMILFYPLTMLFSIGVAIK